MKYDIYKFLMENKKELVDQFKPGIDILLEYEHHFDGHFKIYFNEAYESLIITLVKNEIMDRFNLNYEEASVIMDEDEFKTLILDYFLRRENYVN